MFYPFFFSSSSSSSSSFFSPFFFVAKTVNLILLVVLVVAVLGVIPLLHTNQLTQTPNAAHATGTRAAQRPDDGRPAAVKPLAVNRTATSATTQVRGKINDHKITA